MSFLVAVDPGKHSCGVATFEGGALVRAFMSEELQTPQENASNVISRALYGGPAAGSLVVVVETQRVYPGARSNDPNDLLACALVSGAVAGMAHAHNAEVRYYAPHAWKRTLPKPKRASDAYVVAERILDVLSSNEARTISLPSARSLQHNVWDAIGIGLVALGRLKPGLKKG